ncbi:MAG: hypothetical protein ACRD3E_11055 [Terriglobales bacterium]
MASAQPALDRSRPSGGFGWGRVATIVVSSTLTFILTLVLTASLGADKSDAVKTEQIVNLQQQITDLKANTVSKDQWAEFQRRFDDQQRRLEDMQNDIRTLLQDTQHRGYTSPANRR